MPIGIVYYSDDPNKRVFRTIHLVPGEPDSVFDDPRWVTEGLDPGRSAVLVRVDPSDRRTKFSGTPWTAADEPLPVPSYPSFGPTPDDAVSAQLDMAELTPADILVDIGSGDGRMVIAAAKRGVQAYGIDIDAKLCDIARAEIKAVGIDSQIVCADVFGSDLSGVTVAVVNLGDPWIDKILSVLPATARIVAINCAPDFAPPDVAGKCGEYRLSYWRSR